MVDLWSELPIAENAWPENEKRKKNYEWFNNTLPEASCGPSGLYLAVLEIWTSKEPLNAKLIVTESCSDLLRADTRTSLCMDSCGVPAPSLYTVYQVWYIKSISCIFLIVLDTRYSITPYYAYYGFKYTLHGILAVLIVVINTHYGIL